MKSILLFLIIVLVCTAPVVRADPPKLEVAAHFATIRKEKTNVYKVSATYPVLAGTTPVIRLANETLRQYARQQLAEFVAEASAEYRRSGMQYFRSGWSLQLEPVVSIASPELVSVYFVQQLYMGGIRPDMLFPSYSFGVVGAKPKQLALKDLFPLSAAPYRSISRVALPKLKVVGASKVTGDDGIEELTPEMLRSWVITPASLTLLFAPYKVGSYAEGPFFIKIRFDELEAAATSEGPLAPLRKASTKQLNTPQFKELTLATTKIVDEPR